MKHKLLSLFALAGAMFMSASVWAQSWEAPVKPDDPVRDPFPGTWVTPTAGGQYYIYNVGAAQFMGCGRDWGTRTITTNDSIVSPAGSKYAHGTNKNAAIPYSATSIGENGYLRFSPEKTDMSGFVTGLVDGNASWQDGGNDRAANWQLVPGNDNEFLLHDALNEPYDSNAINEDDPETEEIEGQDKYRVLGVDAVETASYTWTDAWAGTKDGKSYKVAWKFVEATDQVAKDIRAWRESSKATYDEAVKLYNAAMAIYNARVMLYNTLNEAVTAGADYSAASAVYQKVDATEKELLTANTQLLVNVKIATSELPVDITEVLQNPDFEAGTATGAMPPGWDITITGQNLGQQNRTDTNPETGLSITNFIEAWHPSSLGDGVIAQTVYGLPAGVYRLECDASICHDPENGDGSDIVGAGLFIKAGNLRESTPIGTQRLYVSHFEVEFENDGRNEMQFGLFAESTNANWLSADNFQLFYVGQLTDNPNYKNLQKYLEEVQEKYNTVIKPSYLCADSLEALENAMLAASEVSKSATDEEIDAAYATLEKAYAGALTSVKVYATLLPYTSLNEEGSKLAYYEDATAANKWDALSQQLHNAQGDFDTAYEEGTWSDDEVKTHVDGIIPGIIAWVQAHPEALTKGNDLTLLLLNADFEDGLYNAGWDVKDDEVQPDNNYGTLPGWTISSGNITQMNHVIETYHRKFDFNQTIKNMPAGVYDITVQGFVRHDDPDVNDGKSTIFYAGDLETQLMLRSDQWSETQIYDHTTMGDPCGGANDDQTIQNSKGEDVLVPNGMSGFYFWEKVENVAGAEMDYLKWKEGDLYYTNHIKATLNEPGDLTIGMKSLDSHDWIIWDNFQIIFIGDDASVYPEMAEEDFNALTNALNNTDYPTLKAQADYAEIAKEDYSAIATLEAYNAYKAKVDALIAYIQEGTKLGNTLHDLLSEYGEKVNVVMFDTSDFLAGHYSEYSTNLENRTSPDNDYLREAPDVLAIEWTQCAVKSADTGLFNNLGDIIINPQYTTVGGAYTLDGWNMEKEEGVEFGNYLANEGVAEVYSPSGEYKHYQTIKGLSAGYYRVTVDAFFRPGDMKQADGREACVSIPSRAFLFAEGDKMFVTPIKNILVGHDSQEGVGNESPWTWADESVEYTPNNVAAANHYFNNVINYDAEETDLSGEGDNQSVYRNALNAHVGEDGVLTIGITNYGVTDFVTNDWCCFSNWTLSLLGAAPDAIKGVSTKGATAPTAIFTIDGRQASRLQRGMNIVRQADGSVKKVMVK